MNGASEQFLEIGWLLERSRPRAMGLRLGHAAGLFLLIVLLSAYLSNLGGQAARLVNALWGLAMVGLMGAMLLVSYGAYRKAKTEQQRLICIEELIRLRRWDQAAAMLQQMLCRPMRTLQAHVQALIYLSSVLARYNRFDDAIVVQNYLLENAQLDGGTAYGLRLARAMAMLRQDHLVDADRAISELRRQAVSAGRALPVNGGEQPDSPYSLSAGLALVEMYRDVKTGHPAEAVQTFQSALPALREQLGHRVADAYMLAAQAYDRLGQTAQAQEHYEKATLLTPAVELHRRYPETSGLNEKYRAASWPQEVLS